METITLYKCSYTGIESKDIHIIEESERKHLESVFKDVDNPEDSIRRYVLTNHESYKHQSANNTIWEIVYQNENKLWLTNGRNNKVVDITDNFQFNKILTVRNENLHQLFLTNKKLSKPIMLQMFKALK